MRVVVSTDRLGTGDALCVRYVGIGGSCHACPGLMGVTDGRYAGERRERPSPFPPCWAATHATTELSALEGTSSATREPTSVGEDIGIVTKTFRESVLGCDSIPRSTVLVWAGNSHGGRFGDCSRASTRVPWPPHQHSSSVHRSSSSLTGVLASRFSHSSGSSSVRDAPSPLMRYATNVSPWPTQRAD